MIRRRHPVCLHRPRLGRVPELRLPRKYVRKRVPCRLHGQRPPLSSRHCNVKVDRLRRNSLHRPSLTPETAANHPHAGSVVVRDDRDFRRLHVLIPRRRHLQTRRQVRPQLESVHSPRRIPARHLLVNNSPPRCHPLHVPCPQLALVPQAVPMLHRPRQNIGDRLNPAMRMPRKPRQIIRRNVIPKIVE